MINKFENIDDVDRLLFELTAKGEIWAKCPICEIPLCADEVKNSSCEACGEIDYKLIVFQFKEKQLLA